MSTPDTPHAMNFSVHGNQYGGYEVVGVIRIKETVYVSSDNPRTVKDALEDLRAKMAITLECDTDRINFITGDGHCTNDAPELPRPL
jgi:hypothetical protein